MRKKLGARTKKKSNKGPYQAKKVVSTPLEAANALRKERVKNNGIKKEKNKRSRITLSFPLLTGSIGLDSASATMNLGRQLVAQKLPRLWLLRGELGTGKTTFVRGVLRGLGVRERVTSPTFGLVRTYSVHRAGIRFVVHVDAYRIKSKREIAALDLHSALADKKTLVLIEWPERLGKFWRGPATLVQLKHVSSGRSVAIKVR